MRILSILWAGILVVALAACGSIPYEKPEDQEKIKRDLNMGTTPIALVPLKWGYFKYGAEENGVTTIRSLAVIQSGVLSIVGYEQNKYIRQAEFSRDSVDCAYIHLNQAGEGTVWLMQKDRVVYLDTGDDRGVADQALHHSLVKGLSSAGFLIHRESQGKTYRETGVSDRKVVLQPGYGMRAEELQRVEVFNVCGR